MLSSSSGPQRTECPPEPSRRRAGAGVGWTWAWLAGTIACVLLLPWADERLWGLFANTLKLAFGAWVVGVPAGTLLAWLLFRTDLPWRRTVTLVVISLLFVPLYLQAAAWDAGFGRLGWYALQVGALERPPLFGMPAAVWIHGLAAIPWVVVLVGASLSQSEPELEEAALLEHPPTFVFLRVTLRRALPGIVAAGLWVLVMTASEIMVTDLYAVRTYAEELYLGFALGEPTARIAWATLPGVSFAVWLLLTGCWVVGRWWRPLSESPTRRAWQYPLGRWRWIAWALVLLLLFVLVGIPLANLVHNAGVRVERVGSSVERSWSLVKAVRLLVPLPGTADESALMRYRSEFFWSNVTAAASASLSLMLAVPLAWSARRGGWRSLPAVIITAFGLAVPAPLVGVGLVRGFDEATVLFSAGGALPSESVYRFLVAAYDRTIMAPVLAQTIRTLPLAVLVCWYAFRNVRDSLLDAAAVFGATPFQQWLRVAVPSTWRALLLAWVLAFSLGLGELSAGILVAPPGMMTVALRVFDQLHAGVHDQVAALCLISAAEFAVVASLGWMLYRKAIGGEPR